MNNVELQLAEAMLKKMKQLISIGKIALLKRNRNGLDFASQLLELGIFDEEVIWEEILELSINDCIGKPEYDRDAITQEITVLKFKKLLTKKLLILN